MAASSTLSVNGGVAKFSFFFFAFFAFFTNHNCSESIPPAGANIYYRIPLSNHNPTLLFLFPLSHFFNPTLCASILLIKVKFASIPLFPSLSHYYSRIVPEDLTSICQRSNGSWKMPEFHIVVHVPSSRRPPEEELHRFR